MTQSLTGHSTGRIFFGLIRPRRLAQLATTFSIAMAGLNTGANAAPPPPSPWDLAFGCAVQSDYIFRGVTQAPRKCVQAYVGVEAGAGWNNTGFNVTPPFNVMGSGFVYGLNAGLLIEIPGTIFSVGPRIGWQGGQTAGNTANPVASPTFIYDVKTLWTFYQEAVVQVPINFSNTMQSSQLFPFLTASLGLAETKTQVTGTSGAFQVSDSTIRTGLTFSGGVGMPVNVPNLGGPMDVYVQYRKFVFGDGDVNIPGKVTTSYVQQSVNIGARFRF